MPHGQLVVVLGIDSHYRRLQRFFQAFEFNQFVVAQTIISFLPMDKFTLSIDRTNWKFGRVDINILTVGIVYKGICFPTIWKLLKKRGNSNLRERTELTDKCLDFVGLEHIECLLADCEFVGSDRFGYLLDNEVKEKF